MPIREPKPATLRKYGLSLEEWRFMLEAQQGCCAICERVPKSGRLCIDHDHVKNWKRMPPEQRKLYVRCLACWTCNHYTLARGASVSRLTRAAQVLASYEKRKPK